MSSAADRAAFRNPALSLSTLSEIGSRLRDEARQRLEGEVAASPAPDMAVDCLRTFSQRQPEMFRALLDSSLGLKMLVAVFSHSRFLSAAVQENPESVRALLESTDLHRVRRRDEFLEYLQTSDTDGPTLALFRRNQLLRILVRDVLGLASLPEVAGELSSLADAVIEAAYRRIRSQLELVHGAPRAGAQPEYARFSVIALGKLGGEELNYSSDIDLLFVYDANGETDGRHPLSNREFFKKLANQLTELLSAYTPNGCCYRVDLRLRPEGRLGEVCISVDGAKAYYAGRARDWELQMMIKARVAAGDPEPGAALLEALEDRIYSTTLDFRAVEAMSATRDRLDEKLAAKRRGLNRTGLDVKLARGGIRDVEFLTQCLQRLHGGRFAWLRHGSTLLALSRLHDKNLLSPTEYWRLASAYQYLRYVEHRLQAVDDRQVHTLPEDPFELDLLARRMPESHIGAEPSKDRLLQDVRGHLDRVVAIYDRIVKAHRPEIYARTERHGTRPQAGEPDFSNVVRSLENTAPGLAATIGDAPLHRGRRAFEQFLEAAAGAPEVIAALEDDGELTGKTLELFELSPYLSEQLIREPALLLEIRSPGAGTVLSADPGELRRTFSREMMRTLWQSVCDRAPIFETLGRLSGLADSAIAAAYGMALAETVRQHPPQGTDYRPVNQLLIVALGRLGMREFDLASDADLVFVIPDADASEQFFWTRVAERLIDITTAYTGGGTMFAVDTRLRPNGRAGALVQTASSCRDYFARTAEAWEGISWMKSRAVAGDASFADDFLAQIQEVDWRRYGQSGRSRQDLRQMRARLEKEQGEATPLKAGWGGYYDIDFALMYLRLKGAGLFFKVLNTPERIDVIEKMGHLDREDAAFLQDAAVFNRALDHALRVHSGRAEDSVPETEAKLQALQNLVRRWTPAHLNDEPVAVKLASIQKRTRELFERLFR